MGARCATFAPGAGCLAPRKRTTHGLPQLAHARDANRLPVEERPATGARGKGLVEDRCVHHARDGLASANDPDGHRDVGQAVQKVACAVYRVNDPGEGIIGELRLDLLVVTLLRLTHRDRDTL